MKHAATDWAADVWATVQRVRAERPLVQNITNFVAMDLSANALLAIGASPAMIHAVEESAEFTRIVGALVVNIGTLQASWVTGMRSSAAAAREARKPWVLDPVGCGATSYRTEIARELAAIGPSLIRGNASEIMALAGESGAAGKGVDSTRGSEAARDAAKALAREAKCVVAVTGAVDYVTDGTRMTGIANGDPMLSRVTGTGCMATALCGAFLGAGLDPFDAAVAGLAVMGVAAEQAIVGAKGPASFQVALIDAFHTLDDAALVAGMRLR